VQIIARYEQDFGLTIHRDEPVAVRVKKGMPYHMNERMIAVAMGTVFNLPIIVENWQLPAGAFGESCGPS
jgi:hypothetical protein